MKDNRFADLTLKNKEHYLLALVVFSSAILIACCIQEGHNWGDDFALYISQTQAFLNNSINILYEQNKFSTLNSYRVQGPYLYPMGFPLLLSIPYSFVGLNFVALKIFCALFFLASIPLWYTLFRSHFDHPLYTFFIVVGIGCYAQFIIFCDNVLSDLPFLFFSTLVFYVMKRKPTEGNQLVVGFFIFFGFFIRDIGILLLPTFFIYQVFVSRETLIKKKLYLFPYLGFLFFFVLVLLFLPRGTTNHLGLLFSKISWSTVLENAIYYKDLLATDFFYVKPIFLWPIFVLCVMGMISSYKQTLHFSVFVLLVLTIHLIWPGRQGIRLIFPILPFLLFFVVKGLYDLVLYAGIRQRYCAAVLGFWSICLLIINGSTILEFSKTNTNQAYTTEMKTMYDYISKKIPKQEIIGFEEPRLLRLFTGHNALLMDPVHFPSSEISYYLLPKVENNALKNPFEKIYETENFVLVIKERKN